MLFKLCSRRSGSIVGVVALSLGGMAFMPAGGAAQMAAHALSTWPERTAFAPAVSAAVACHAASASSPDNSSGSYGDLSAVCDQADWLVRAISFPAMRSGGKYTARGALIGALVGGLIGATVFHFRHECITRDAHIPCEAGYVLYFAVGALPGAMIGLTVGSKIS